MYDSNYENDHRVLAKNKWYDSHDDKKMLVFVTVFDGDKDEEFEASFPFKWKTCGTCNGRGSHVNPSIDSHGLSAEDFAEDPDFAEEYFGGTYDQACNGCGGRTTERVIDENRFSNEQKSWTKLLEEKWKDDADYRAECAAERRMGA